MSNQPEEEPITAMRNGKLPHLLYILLIAAGTVGGWWGGDAITPPKNPSPTPEQVQVSNEQFKQLSARIDIMVEQITQVNQTLFKMEMQQTDSFRRSEMWEFVMNLEIELRRQGIIVDVPKPKIRNE